MEKSFLEIHSSILGSIREPLILLDPGLKVVTANPSFYRTFNVKPDETEGALIYDLGNRQWDIPKLRELLEDILPQNTSFHDFEVEHDFETIGHKIMHLNARRIYDQGNQTQLILLAIEDVTEREYYKRHLEEIVEERTREIRKLKDQLETERAYLQEEIKLVYNHEDIVGKSDAINYVFFKVEQIACTDTNVLILGETGTGKELVASAIGFLPCQRSRNSRAPSKGLASKISCTRLRFFANTSSGTSESPWRLFSSAANHVLCLLKNSRCSSGVI